MMPKTSLNVKKCESVSKASLKAFLRFNFELFVLTSFSLFQFYRRSLSAKSFYLRNLRPTSDYDVFIQDCNANVISTEINFQTKRDGESRINEERFSNFY